MSKWDGFSAFDEEKWDLKYKRPTSNRATLVLAVLAFGLACMLFGYTAPRQHQHQGRYDYYVHDAQTSSAGRRDGSGPTLGKGQDSRLGHSAATESCHYPDGSTRACP